MSVEVRKVTADPDGTHRVSPGNTSYRVSHFSSTSQNVKERQRSSQRISRNAERTTTTRTDAVRSTRPPDTLAETDGGFDGG